MCTRNVSYVKIKEGRKGGKKGEQRGGREGRRRWEVGGEEEEGRKRNSIKTKL